MKDYCLSFVGLFVFGQLITNVTFAEEPTYIVKEGDTLRSIAKSHGLDFGQLCKSNGKPQDWSLIRPGEKIVVGELLDESSEVSLYAYKTQSDLAYEERRHKEGDMFSARRSLFMRRRSKAGTNDWQLIMTSNDKNREFEVVKARMSKDGRFVWMVCDPHTCTYLFVCSLELATGKFRELIDGCSVTEQSDGTLFVEGKKTYLSDKNGEPLGAAWYDLWMTFDGKVVRKTKPVSKAEMENECAAEQQKANRK